MINVSVIVPIYNADKHLFECLNSLKKQKLKNIEFILVNDGSTDRSEEICKKFLNDSRFIYLKKKNGGQVSAYLEGIKRSKGEYIGFVDADDYIDERMYSFLYNKVNEYKADIAICCTTKVTQTNNIISTEKLILKDGFYDDKDVEKIYNLTLPPFNGYHMHNSRWNKLYKKTIIEKNLKYCKDKVRTFEDRFIVPACIFSSKKIYVTSKNLYFYREGIETSHLKSRSELYDILKKLKMRQKEMLIENNLFNKYKDSYEIAQLNYLSLLIDRNIINHNKFKTKLFYAKQIIKDKDYQYLIKIHKKELTGLKGLLIKYSYFFKSPFILCVLSYLKK